MTPCNFLTSYSNTQSQHHRDNGWCMNRFSEVARTSLQNIHGKHKGFSILNLFPMTEKMHTMVQIFQKIAEKYDQMKKITLDNSTSENIEDLEDSLSVVSGTSGFSSGSQMLQMKDYDENSPEIIDKRINYLSRLEVPLEIFTSTNFDWAAKFYASNIEELCDAQGDYTPLKEFRDALQDRIDKQVVPYSRRAHRLAATLSENENRFSSSSMIIESQLKANLPLTDREIETIFNKLEEHSPEDQTGKDTEDDSLSDYMSDCPENDRIGSAVSTIHKKLGEDKKWLVQQYRNLASNIIRALDDKPMKIAENMTLLGSTFRSIIIDLLRYSENNSEVNTQNRSWINANFPFTRIVKWNGFHFDKTFKQDEQINLLDEIYYLKEHLTNTLVGSEYDQNPIAVKRREDFKSLFNSLCMDDKAKPGASCERINDEPMQHETVFEKLESFRVLNIPEFDLDLAKKIKLWRDIGLIHEYPFKVSVHIVVLFLLSDKYDCDIEEKDFCEKGKLISTELKSIKGNYKLTSKINTNYMMIATLAMQCFTEELESDVDPSVLKYLNQLKQKIQKAVNGSIVNCFYFRGEKLYNALEKYYTDDIDELYKNRTCKLLRGERKEENIKLLKDLLSGTNTTHKKVSNARQFWIQQQADRMKLLWNFSPFEKKLQELLNHTEDYGKSSLSYDSYRT